MNGSGHYALAAQLLAEAKDADSDADRTDVMLLLKFAELHVGLAQAAATALPTVVKMMGDSSEVTAWALMIGATDDHTKPEDVPEAVILPASWPPMVGDLWADPAGHRWFARRGDDGVLMVSCYQGDAWGGELPDFCSPDALLKVRESLTLLNREEPPF